MLHYDVLEKCDFQLAATANATNHPINKITKKSSVIAKPMTKDYVGFQSGNVRSMLAI
jgi:hypothetical protein